ncbi:UNVERIFIED_CONTAM: hypothetical protein HDU68_011176, partial [Siphonaria sp. JEL0065]
CSRAIFQRMRSYALYRIASTIHFLLFFFISICAYGFSLPPKLILLIAVLNDAATLVISVDNAQISQRPDKWRLGQLITLSFVLGFLLMIISWLHFWVAHYGFGYTTDSFDDFPDHPNAGYFYENMPSWTFILVVAGTQVFAMFMSIFGVRALDATKIGWGWGIGVLAVSTVMFMLLDIVKVYLIRKWSFDLTVKLYPTKARKAELEERLTKRAVKRRVDLNVEKARKVLYLTMGVIAWKKAVEASKKKKIAGVAGSASTLYSN